MRNVNIDPRDCGSCPFYSYDNEEGYASCGLGASYKGTERISPCPLLKGIKINIVEEWCPYTANYDHLQLEVAFGLAFSKLDLSLQDSRYWVKNPCQSYQGDWDKVTRALHNDQSPFHYGGIAYVIIDEKPVFFSPMEGTPTEHTPGVTVQGEGTPQQIAIWIRDTLGLIADDNFKKTYRGNNV